MSRVSVTEAKRSFSELLNRAAYGQERIVVTSHSKPKAAVISIEDLRRLEELEEALAAAEALEAERANEPFDVEDIQAKYLRPSEQRGERAKVLKEANRLRDAFAAQYGTVTIDLVQAIRQERERRLTSVSVAEDEEGYEADN